MFYRRGGIVKAYAISEIFILILALFSFTFLVAQSSIVSGQTATIYPGSTNTQGAFYVDRSFSVESSKFNPGFVNYKVGKDGFMTLTQGSNTYVGPAESVSSGLNDVGIKKLEGSINTNTAKEPPPSNKPRVDIQTANVAGSTGVKTYATRGFADVDITITGSDGAARTFKGFAYKQVNPDGSGQLLDGSGNPLANGQLTADELSEFDKAITSKGGSFQEANSFQGPLGTSGWFGHLAQGFSTAIMVVGAIQLIGGLAGFEESLTNSLSLAAGSGIMATAALNALGPTGAQWISPNSFLYGNAGPFTGAGWIGLGVAVVVFALTYKDESQEIYNFQCLPYQAPIGGKDCEACNSDPNRPCSEYRCRALGQACELVNEGTTDEKCVWVNPNDATSPTITPWDTPLTENHRYTNHDTRPTSLGTKIVKNGATDGCLAAFTPLVFGVTTNEPAQCKIDVDHKDSFDEMQFFFGNTNLFLYNHTQQFSLPSVESIKAEAPELDEDGKYDFFVRCRDKNGNENVDEFAVQLCVDPSPDTTAPVIVDTSIPSDSYVKFGVGSVPVDFYINEPASCKWSTQDKSYDVMENTMTCATSLTQINARERYTCSTSLSGIMDRKENNFFIRCKDQPNKPEENRNVNVVSYKYNLIGSQPLNIISVGPTGTVTGSTNTVPVDLKVTTDDGAAEGIAICSFSPSGLSNSFIPMFETRAVEHTQRLDLVSGSYKYYIRCADFGGNSAEAEIEFSVETDTNAPLITRAYRDSSNNALKIVTNEDASCVYSLNSCNFNFDEGIELLYISTSNKKSHYAEWKPNVAYYIKCKDVFENEPGPNTCSLVASATKLR